MRPLIVKVAFETLVVSDLFQVVIALKKLPVGDKAMNACVATMTKIYALVLGGLSHAFCLQLSWPEVMKARGRA